MRVLVTSAPTPVAADVQPARAAAQAWIGEHAFEDELASNLLLIVSELVTNSIRHARTSFTLAMDVLDDGGVRIEVFDLDSRQPVLLGADGEATSGRGLQ